MRRKKSFSSRLAIASLSMTLFVPSNFSAVSYAQSNLSVYSSNDVGTDKVSERLLNQFDDQKYVTFLVKFRDQVNTPTIAAIAAEKAEDQKLSEARSELAVRSTVVSSLKSKASETQHNIQEFLGKKKKDGSVKDYESFYIVNAMAVTGTEEVMNELAEFGEVEKILPNEIRHQIEPVQETTKTSAKINNTEDATNIEWNIEKIGAPQTWDRGIDGTGVVVANIDTGVQWDHPALKEKYRGYDPAHPDQPNNEFNWFDATGGAEDPYDAGAHGTHTMGTMVGSTNDKKVGVAPGAKWIAVKAFSTLGATDADLLQAGEWILAPKDKEGNPHPEKAPDIVNNSWGGGPGLNEWYRLMVQNWREAGILPVFSAGNSGPGTGTAAAPGNYPESFTVGALDIDEKLADFSSRGPAPYDEIKPNISAPGVNVLSTVPGSTYGAMSGTSMAAPAVAGAAALLLQANASLTVDDIEQILMKTAKPLTDSKYTEVPNSGYGYGLLNVFKAVSSITNNFGAVSGQVLGDGEDNKPPTFQHTVPSEAYEGLALPLEINAKDNVSVKKVELQYRIGEDQEWQSIPTTRTSGNYLDGTYRANIPGEKIAQPEISYRWKIVDFGGNETTSDSYSTKIVSGASVGYKQDFESIPIGWYSYGKNNSWEQGVFAKSGPIKPGADVLKNKMYGTSLSGAYAPNADMSLAMPPINVPEGQTFLNFKHWYGFEYKTDFGYIYVSTDKTNWEQVAQYENTANGWQDGKIDLSKYAGKKIYVIFNVKSNDSYQAFGWHLDDISITNTALNVSNTIQKKLVDSNDTQTGNQTLSTEQANVSGSSALPLQARVSVLETGRSVNTNPADGSYLLSQETGTFTLKAEAYGFQSASHTVNIADKNVTKEDFTLKPIPKGTVTGKVVNKVTGKPIQNARLMLMEDAVIKPVLTDENGQFTITAYEGTYTMHVSAPNNFYNQDMTITISGGKTTEQNSQLKPFVGQQGEIGYDDGSLEAGTALTNSGNKFAVKMSLPKGKKRALVTEGLFAFHASWPTPGGTEFKVEVYDANGNFGAPGKKLAGPINATAVRNGQYMSVDLSSEGIVVDSDFYIVYVQENRYPSVPGIGRDDNGDKAYRSWECKEGIWSQTPTTEGNYMIRAHVSYEVAQPLITQPVDGKYTNEKTVSVAGETTPLTKVHIFRDGSDIGTTTSNEDGKFKADVLMSKGNNVITATASTETGMTEPSNPVKVILDETKPQLTITAPTNGYKTNKDVVIVKGTATDENFDSVMINGTKAKVDNAGSFTLPILLVKGENSIEAIATDKAGNVSTLTKNVGLDQTSPSAPKIKAVDDNDTVIVGTAEANSNITVKIKDKVIATGKADSKGAFSIKISRQTAGIVLSVFATDAAGNQGKTSTTTVLDRTAPNAPKIKAVDDNDTVIVGTAEANSKVIVKYKNKIIVSGKANSKGAFSLKISRQKAGTALTAFAIDAAGNQSKAATTTVLDRTAPNAPKITSFFAKGKFEIKGTAEAGATIIVKKGTKEVAKVKVSSNGTFVAILPKPSKGKNEYVLYAIDHAGNKSNSVKRSITLK
ncbi:S8 family serine peptidase [Gottfriedia acidiceleris]|uniref:S8 family serine peptidase n=1 Tax=Gottfriedia acidiceleris TaxID=371036 RepID=UPI00101B85B7|nr:S8 family serine peptidase [Gottfriedia acidiceleris]